jgi:ketosteroid isomerase-like protein
MPESPKSVLNRLNAAIRQKDFDACMACCTDDTEWVFVGERTLKGKAAVRQWMESAYQEPPRFQVHRMIAEDDSLAVLGEITLEDEQGKPVRHQYCDVWRLRDGKMAALQAFVIPG